MEQEKTKVKVTLCGNPNVGKSTVFNALTGMHQHTGNWTGKTVENAVGWCDNGEVTYEIADIPGTYSLKASSKEEEVARDHILYGGAEVTAIVCDATALDRNLNLCLQTLEITDKAVVVVNLMDEAKKKGITIDFDELSMQLGVPVVPTSAAKGKGLLKLLETMEEVRLGQRKTYSIKTDYGPEIEQAIATLLPAVQTAAPELPARFAALRLLEGEFPALSRQPEVSQALTTAWVELDGMTQSELCDRVVKTLLVRSEQIAAQCVNVPETADRRDRMIDRILTSKLGGIPAMILMLGVILWITIAGANIPSDFLFHTFSGWEEHLLAFFRFLHVPEFVTSMLVYGLYRTLYWVVSVMLPPMAIFFPLFTLLEDSGYLPRVAFNLDQYFKRARAHGKQALTMCMGLGCNACGVIGCRIIDSPRERLIGILTNAFVPCNGRFPSLIALITIFFVGGSSLLQAGMLTGFIALGVLMTLLVSRVLSATVLKGMPSAFALELPPYRKPQIGKVVVRSIFDRTLFVLGRAVTVAAPAGLIIYLAANIMIGDMSILTHVAAFLDPLGKLVGMDGIILVAFVLGFPANEIVFPIIIMGYTAAGVMVPMDDITGIGQLLMANGWTITTALCTSLFFLFHFPCATTCLTIKKETGSLKWTGLSFLLPTCVGLLLCFAVATLSKLVF